MLNVCETSQQQLNEILIPTCRDQNDKIALLETATFGLLHVVLLLHHG